MVEPITGGLTQPGSKELIIRGGHNIAPQMIEAALHKPPAAALAAAVGKPDEKAGELPVVFVLLNRRCVSMPSPGFTGQLAHIHLANDSQALAAAIGERLAGYAVGHRIHWIS